jgi:NAD(P)-dependent dehydrogenase (short-subunit alcohol dehydrogenase family)
MKKPLSIITGAAKGIGKAIALQLKNDGFFVVIADMDAEGGKLLEAEMGVDHCRFIPCNISNEIEVQQFFEQAKQISGSIDVVVNNAGIIRDKMIWKMTVAEFDEVIAVNLRGTWMMCREAARIMKEQNFGRIVNIASRAWLGNPGQSNYSASKAGVVALTRVLALELGKYNVFVNAVAPGLIDTPLTQKLESDVLKKLVEAQPTKTMGKPEDVASAVSFLANSKTQFITGQLIYVDGGKSIGANLF